jgi:hypothetical protein
MHMMFHLTAVVCLYDRGRATVDTDRKRKAVVDCPPRLPDDK